MMKVAFNRIVQTLFVLSSLLGITAPSYAEPTNLSLLKKEIVSYHDSGAYAKELAGVIGQAQAYILKAAKLNAHQPNKKKLALVLDIDETSLSNYNRIVQRDFVGNKKQIQQAIMAADAPAIAPMLALYNDARKQGIHVFFVTGRPLADLKATRTNLLRAGFKHWTGLYLRPDDYHKPSIAPFKTQARKSITKQGYTIIASIGDQQSDLAGGFAQKAFKLPNPFYYLP